jgi:hypothetical protein
LMKTHLLEFPDVPASHFVVQWLRPALPTGPKEDISEVRILMRRTSQTVTGGWWPREETNSLMCAMRPRIPNIYKVLSLLRAEGCKMLVAKLTLNLSESNLRPLA